jgi:hypothetical protein
MNPLSLFRNFVTLIQKYLENSIINFFFALKRPTWWNGIHSRLKICPLQGMGSNPIVGNLLITGNSIIGITSALGVEDYEFKSHFPEVPNQVAQ